MSVVEGSLSTEEPTVQPDDSPTNDQERKTATPSVSPKPRESTESVVTEELEAGNGDEHNLSENEVEGSSEDEYESSDSGVPPPFVPRYAGLRLRRAMEEVKNTPSYKVVDKRATTLTEHLRMMEWVAKTLLNADKDYVRRRPEASTRKMAIPENKRVTWLEWKKFPEPPPHHAVYTLIEEPPVSGRGENDVGETSREAQDIITEHPSRHLGIIRMLPPRLRLASLPVRNILATMASNKSSAQWYPFSTLLRPFKILVYCEDDIRRRKSELDQLCEESVAMLPTQMGSEQGVKGGNTVDDKSSQDKDSIRIPPTNFLRPGYDFTRLTLEERQEAARDLRVLVSFMDEYIFPLQKALRTAEVDQVYFYELWYLFSPGSIVYIKDATVPQKLWRVVQGTGGRRPMSHLSLQIRHLDFGGTLSKTKCDPFNIDCFYIDFNGFEYIRVRKTFKLDEFKDLQSIKSLPIIPSHVAESQGLVDRNLLMERGKEFISYTTLSYCYYSGRSISREPSGNVLQRPDSRTMASVSEIPEVIESPVVVDFQRCLQSIPNWNPGNLQHELSKTPEHELQGNPNDFVEDDRVWDVRLAERILDYTDQTQALGNYDRIPPTGDNIMLLPDRVFAFVLRTHRWACMPIGITRPGYNEQTLKRMGPEPSAWDYLEIDPNHRSVIQSLMATHFAKKKSERRQFDLIQDKGKGLVILLHGVPGVGKTSTAETVAQYYNKPLLPITCGDLGMTPKDVESNLQNSFQMAQAWDCVLLLDEADVFLAERSQDNIERNALVSVFLRVLEYYEGVLFLTTNKVGSFDEAFKSRMSMALYYPPLSGTQTEKIWGMQIKRTEKLAIEAAPNDESVHVKFDQLDIMKFAADLWNEQQFKPEFKPVWNGRQIRNAFQTAVALAEWQKQDGNIPGPINVKREHFEKVARVSMEFNSYLYGVKHSRGDEMLNLKKEQRYDAFNPNQVSPFGFGSQGFGQGQQGAGSFGGWNLSQQPNTMQYGAQTGMNMNGSQGFGTQPQHQGGIPSFQSWNAGPSGIGHTGMGNPGIASAGMGQPGMGNAGIGNMGMGMQPGTANPPAASNQNVHTQPAGQNTSSNVPLTGMPQPLFGQGGPQQGAGGWPR